MDLVRGDKMNIERIVVKFKITGKREDTSLILRRSRYFLAVQNIDKNSVFTESVGEKRVEFADYCALNVGDVVDVTLYSPDKRRWFYSPMDAELFGGND